MKKNKRIISLVIIFFIGGIFMLWHNRVEELQEQKESYIGEKNIMKNRSDSEFKEIGVEYLGSASTNPPPPYYTEERMKEKFVDFGIWCFS